MKKTLSNILAILLLFVLLSSCGERATEPPAPQEVEQISPLPEASAPVSASPAEESDAIGELIAAMSLEEKCAQLLMAGIEGTVAGADARYAVEQLGVGGVILFRRNVTTAAQVTALNQSLRDMAALPLLLGVDEEGGRVSRLPDGMERLPAMGEAEGDFYAMGFALGETLAELGYNVNFAPVLDVLSNPRNTVIGDRAFGAAADEVIAEALPFSAGLADGGVMPVGKHFPGHGDTDADSHASLPLVSKTREELDALELAPFCAAIEAGLPAVMVAHVVVQAVDAARPATLSYPVVTELLREELGFDGLVITDDLTMGALREYSMGERAVQAVEAGCDLLLVCHRAENLRAAHGALVDAVNQGRLTQARIEESLRRVLTVKNLFT